MSSLSSLTHSSATVPAPSLPERTLWLMSIACGVCAANICYNQPLLGEFAVYFKASAAQVGWIAMASQIGYGLGLLFFLPLGDIIERRRLVVVLVYACSAALVATAAAPSLSLLFVFNLLAGALSMSPQVLIPLAVELSPAGRRGHTVGVMMTGLLAGVLLARTLAGFIGDYFGWRAMYGLAAGMMIVLALLLRAGLPHSPPSLKLSYRSLMRSLWQVAKTQPRLWQPAIVSAISYASFSVFWTSLAFLMVEKFHRGSSETGLFGVVGLAGALAAPYAGRLADKRGAAIAISISLAIVLVAFGLMWAWVTIPILILGVLLMDVGVQTVQVAAQGEVLALAPEARSRINTIYMVTRFLGGALGSLAGATAWSWGRWPAVCAVAISMTAIAMGIHFIGNRRAPVLIAQAP